MLTSVGREVLGKGNEEFEKVIENQFSIMLDLYMEKFNSAT